MRVLGSHPVPGEDFGAAPSRKRLERQKLNWYSENEAYTAARLLSNLSLTVDAEQTGSWMSKARCPKRHSHSIFVKRSHKKTAQDELELHCFCRCFLNLYSPCSLLAALSLGTVKWPQRCTVFILPVIFLEM